MLHCEGGGAAGGAGCEVGGAGGERAGPGGEEEGEVGGELAEEVLPCAGVGDGGEGCAGEEDRGGGEQGEGCGDGAGGEGGGGGWGRCEGVVAAEALGVGFAEEDGGLGEGAEALEEV